MLYDMDIEPGHPDCLSQVTHVDLAAYQPGSPHYERLMSQLADAQRFTLPSSMEPNV